MKRNLSFLLAFAILSLCVAPLFFSDNNLRAQTDSTEQVAQPGNYGGDIAPAPAVAESPAAAESAQAAEEVAPAPEAPSFLQLLLAWIKTHTAEFILALLAIVKIIVNLTPTETDNKWYDLVERFINSLFPNLKKGGGTFASKP